MWSYKVKLRKVSFLLYPIEHICYHTLLKPVVICCQQLSYGLYVGQKSPTPIYIRIYHAMPCKELKCYYFEQKMKQFVSLNTIENISQNKYMHINTNTYNMHTLTMVRKKLRAKMKCVKELWLLATTAIFCFNICYRPILEILIP